MPQNRTLKFSIYILFSCCVFSFSGNKANAQDTKATLDKIKCDFSRYKPLTVSHNNLLFESAVKKVAPVYPLTAKLVKAQGKVEVLLLINRRGEVTKTCVLSGHPLLRVSAQTAALQWKFKKNFGFAAKQKRQYIQARLPFNFQSESLTP